MDHTEAVNEVRLLVCPSESGDRVGELLSLLHPKYGNPTSYFHVNGILHEIHRFKEHYCSWFVGDYVSQDGCLFSATPIDPVFIFLPLFHDARMKKLGENGMFRSLEDILVVDGYPGYRSLSYVAENAMQVVCEVKEVGSCRFFRLDDDKVLAWMNYKAHLLKEKLYEIDKNYAAQDDEKTLVDSVSIMGDYLKEDPWLNLLCAHQVFDLSKALNSEEFSVSTQDGVLCRDAVEVRNGCRKVTAKSVSKKSKVETNSKNIKDMFFRASMRKK